MDADRLHVDVGPADAVVQVVRATGPLSLGTVTTLRTGTEKALAPQPEHLVLDLSGVLLRDRPAARVIPLIAAEAAVWPVTRVAIAGAAVEIERSALRSSGLSLLAWFPDVEAAVNAATGRPVTVRTTLPGTPAAAATARRVVATVYAHDDDIRERAEIVLTELVNNAVQHAHGPLEVRIVNTGRIHVSVHDSGPDLPTAGGGYGLDVVRRFAIAWGWRRVTGGKVVWAVVGAAPRVHRPVRLTCSR